MKTYLHFLLFMLFASLSFGQVSFSDDFESYTVGDGIAEVSDDWQLWETATTLGEDAFITDENANGGSNSLRLPGGQDVDIVLPFGDTYTEGTFSYSMDIYIPQGRGSYFNFQGDEEIGTQWTLQFEFQSNGLFVVDNGVTDFIVNAYPFDEWINVSVDVNLTENLWRTFINGECLGSFQNTDDRNKVAALDLFPIDGNSMAFVDNVKYSYDTSAEPVDIQLDAFFIAGVDSEVNIGVNQSTFYGIAGSTQDFDVRVFNNGATPIENFSITTTVDGVVETQNYDTPIASLDYADVPSRRTIPFENGEKLVTVSVNNVNGLSDDNTCNNTGPMLFNGFTPAADKKVWVEEATGSWCTWCPRGAVYMDYYQAKYPELFVGVAVHAGDPMAFFDWAGQTDNPNTVPDEGVNFGTLISGYPSSALNRVLVVTETAQGPRKGVDPASLEGQLVESAQIAPLVTLNHGAEFDEATRELKVNVETGFKVTVLSSGTKLVVGLTEDGVTGTGDGIAGQTTDYDQINAYSGGTVVGNLFGLDAGPMQGYENRPNPVPATDMVYEHVARAMLTDWGGIEDAYVDADGENKRDNHTFTITVPADWNIDNMHIVSAFVKSDGTIENCNSSSIADAVASGYTSTMNVYLDSGIDVYPNPTNGLTNVSMNFDAPTDINLQVADAMGKVISNKNYGTLIGQNNFQYDGSDLTPGVYYMRFNSGKEFTSKRLIITE